MNNISKNRASMRVGVKPTASFPHFAQPMVVSYFSMDQDRRFTPDCSQLRYMFLPKDSDDLNWDLNHGFEKVQRCESKSTEKLDNLLRGLLASGLTISQEAASFMCYRGLLTNVMTTPYEQNEGWEILVSKFRGVLFLCAQETPEQRRERMNKDEGLKRFCSWGFKFEQYMTTDQPGCPPDIDMPVKEGEEFCCLFRTKLNDRRLMYGAEMDAVTSDVPLEDCLEELMKAEFIELKTSRKLEYSRQARNFKRFKLLKWWAQNFLVNVAHIICGFRDDRGIIENISFYKVHDIPKMAKDLWVPAVCMTFLDQFLSFVQRTVWECPQSDDPNTVWRFRWEPGVKYVTGDVIPGRSQYSFLPDWFLSSVAARESHPLDFCIRIYSSRHGNDSSQDDQRSYTAKVMFLSKNLALQRASSKRPPSPKSIMLAQKGSKVVAKQSDDVEGASVPSVAPASTSSDNLPINPNVIDSLPEPSNTASKIPPVVQVPQGRNIAQSTIPKESGANGPVKKRHRRRARSNRPMHSNSSTPHPGRSDRKVAQPSIATSDSLQSKKAKHIKRSPQSIITSNFDTSVMQTSEVSSEHFEALTCSQNSYLSADLQSVDLSHVEEVAYDSTYTSLDGTSYIVPQTAEQLSPSNLADQFSSQSFLTPSPQDDSYSHHSMLSNSLSSGSMMGDCYSSTSFSVDDLPQPSYLVSSDSDYLNQTSYLQSAVPVQQASHHAYLPSSGDYITDPTFLPVSQSDEMQASDMFLNETSDDLPSPSLLSPASSVSQTYLGTNTDISSEDIQTAEGSLTAINQLSPSAYLPSTSGGNQLTLQM